MENKYGLYLSLEGVTLRLPVNPESYTITRVKVPGLAAPLFCLKSGHQHLYVGVKDGRPILQAAVSHKAQGGLPLHGPLDEVDVELGRLKSTRCQDRAQLRSAGEESGPGGGLQLRRAGDHNGPHAQYIARRSPALCPKAS